MSYPSNTVLPKYPDNPNREKPKEWYCENQSREQSEACQSAEFRRANAVVGIQQCYRCTKSNHAHPEHASWIPSGAARSHEPTDGWNQVQSNRNGATAGRHFE